MSKDGSEPTGWIAGRRETAERIDQVLEIARRDPRLPGGLRRRRYLLGLFLQGENLGWGVDLHGGDLSWSRGFPPDARNRLIFRNAGDFHRFASGTPWRWLSLRRRIRYSGSGRALRTLRKPIVRAYGQFRGAACQGR